MVRQNQYVSQNELSWFDSQCLRLHALCERKMLKQTDSEMDHFCFPRIRTPLEFLQEICPEWGPPLGEIIGNEESKG